MARVRLSCAFAFAALLANGCGGDTARPTREQAQTSYAAVVLAARSFTLQGQQASTDSGHLSDIYADCTRGSEHLVVDSLGAFTDTHYEVALTFTFDHCAFAETALDGEIIERRAYDRTIDVTQMKTEVFVDERTFASITVHAGEAGQNAHYDCADGDAVVTSTYVTDPSRHPVSSAELNTGQWCGYAFDDTWTPIRTGADVY